MAINTPNWCRASNSWRVISVGVINSRSVNSSTNASVNSDGTVKRAVKRTGNAVQRTGNKVEGAVDNAADATRSGAYRAKNAVGGVAARARGRASGVRTAKPPKCIQKKTR